MRAEPVMVPVWVRGQESLAITSPSSQPLVMLGLGNSIGTPPDGIEAEIWVVRSFDELDASPERAKGKIVVYNVPYTNYGQTVQYRGAGASRAARHGALAAIVRSVGPPGLRTPHTGGLNYADDQPKIPGAAVPVEDADRLQRLQDRGLTLVVRLSMEARMLPDAESANVIGEIVGRERPEEVVVLGCHFDSWDVGTGATDDGGGCIASDLPGVTVARRLDKLGMTASDTAPIFFEDVRVPQRFRIGAEGRGLLYQMHGFLEERLWASACGLVSMERLIDEAIAYGRQRKAFGRRIIDNQSVHFRLAELQTKIELLRSLIYRAVEHYVSGLDATRLVAMCKLTAGRLQREVTDSCLQFYGAMGFMHEREVSRYFTDARLTSIGGGADEVMLMMLCRLNGTLR